MTEDRDFKMLVRDRMVRTGETYTAARAAMRPEPPDTQPIDQAADALPRDTKGPASSGSGVAAYRELDPALTPQEIMSLHSVGLTPDRLRELRAALPDAGVHTLVGAHVLGLTAVLVEQWRAVDPEMTVDTMQGAQSLGLTPQLYGDYLDSYPGTSMADIMGWVSLGLRP